VLLGTKSRDFNAQPIELGRSNGIGEGFVKINLDSDWRLAKRTYNGKALGHIYLTSDSTVASR
jgi:N-acetylmuramoyl-L-alanine amidase